MSKYLVPWSGGLDSTYLLYKLLSEGHAVEAVLYSIDIDEQGKRQTRAISAMAEGYFSKNYPATFSVLHHAGSMPGVAHNTPVYLTQVLWHIFMIMKSVSDHDYVALGYVMNDDAVSFLPEISTIYNSYSGIARSLPELVFPLVKTKKNQAYYNLPRELRESVTWCESTEPSDRCGTCPSCKRMVEVLPTNEDLFGKT